MLALFIALLQPAPPAPAGPPAPTAQPADLVLWGQGDALLLACHTSAHGWFTGRACQRAAAGASVQGASHGAQSLAMKPTSVKCGGTEGHLSYGKTPVQGPLFSAGRPPRACPERKPYVLPDATAAAIRRALVADQTRDPAPYRGDPEDQRAKRPFSSAFSMSHALVIDIEGKGQREEIISLEDMAKGLHLLVRVDDTDAPAPKVTVLLVSPHGPVQMERGDCGDFDGDGVAELVVRVGGETERSYELLRFVRGEAEIVARLGCGD